MIDLSNLHVSGVSSRLTLSKDEWISVLRLATFWYFLKFRKLAISELDQAGELTPKDKVVYGRKFKIQAWLTAGCMELVGRDETISKEEAIAIDYETTFALFRIREKRLRQFIAVTIDIEDVLKEELDVIKHFETEYEEVDVDIEFESTANLTSPPFSLGNSPPILIAEQQPMDDYVKDEQEYFNPIVFSSKKKKKMH